jgi:hypothetical protein
VSLQETYPWKWYTKLKIRRIKKSNEFITRSPLL